jgi:hypothetical protein
MKISEKQKTEIISRFVNTLDTVLKVNPDFAAIGEVKTAVNFYNKTKDGEFAPSDALSVINKHLLSKLSDEFLKEFSSALEGHLDGLTLGHGESGTTISYSLPPITISIDLDLVIKETDTTIATVTFGTEQNVEVVVEGIHRQDSGSYMLDKIEASMSLFVFAKMMVSKKKKFVASCKFNVTDWEVSK